EGGRRAPAGGADGGPAGVLGRPHAREPRAPAGRNLPRDRRPRRRRARRDAAPGRGRDHHRPRPRPGRLRRLRATDPRPREREPRGHARGAGAGPHGPGLSAVHTHMTNTMNTPVEALEAYYPLRVRRYAVRRGSGGRGRHRGGDGLVREIELLVPTEVTLLAERRRVPP